MVGEEGEVNVPHFQSIINTGKCHKNADSMEPNSKAKWPWGSDFVSPASFCNVRLGFDPSWILLVWRGVQKQKQATTSTIECIVDFT